MDTTRIVAGIMVLVTAYAVIIVIVRLNRWYRTYRASLSREQREQEDAQYYREHSSW